MSNRLGIDPEVLKAANETLTEFVNAEPTFYNTEANCKQLQNYLKDQKLPLEGWSNLGAWVAAYWACTRPDAKFPLTPVPARETEQERIERLHARDRSGYTGAKHPSRAEKASESGRTLSEFEKQCADIKAKATADNDLSKIPSVESLIAGEAPMFPTLSTTDAMRLSLTQAKLYSKRSSEASWEIQRRQSEARAARLKELGK